jgi:hypothetical protein
MRVISALIVTKRGIKLAIFAARVPGPSACHLSRTPANSKLSSCSRMWSSRSFAISASSKQGGGDNTRRQVSQRERPRHWGEASFPEGTSNAGGPVSNLHLRIAHQSRNVNDGRSVKLLQEECAWGTA